MALALGTSFARINAGDSSVKRIFAGASGVWNADAADWIRRVYANGGTVSTATANAVTNFCNAIDAAGIRDRFYRLSLMAGSNLNAALVPLYRGPSRTGTQYGNTTDTNVGPFVSGDYEETGASGGLLGNGTSKYLLCGDVLGQVNRANSHQAVYGASLSLPNTSDRVLIGAGGAFAAGITLLQTRGGSVEVLRYFSANSGTLWVDGVATSQGFLLGSAISNTDLRAYANGVQSGSTQTGDRGSGAQTSTSMAVFCWNNNGTATALTAARVMAYSAGLGLTATQAAAYNTAMQAFQTALGRNV